MKIFPKIAACAALVALFAFDASAQDTKKPWKLTLKHDAVDVLVVPYTNGSSQSFYFMPFEVKNDSEVAAPLGLHFVAHVGTSPKKRRTHIALPHPDAELFFKRMARDSSIKNVQEINAMKTLEPGQSVKGIAVFGTFDREWDKGRVVVTGLEPRAIRTRVRDYGNAGFVLVHRAYAAHNKKVRQRAGK
ncbi:MAG: hypothetical protein AAGD14_19110 [Planctomycetota bacterium]